MGIFSLWLAMAGCAVSAAAAVWMMVGFKPDNPRYVDDGMLYPGMQQSQVLPRLLKDQRWVAALVVLGAALQLLGAVLAVLANNQNG